MVDCKINIVMCLYKYNNTITAICTARPSKSCKSPYVADIIVEGDTYLAHTPALGMDGYVSPGRKLLVCPSSNSKGTCKYSVLASYDNESNIYVGANPLHANKAFNMGLSKGLFANEFGNVDQIIPEHQPPNSDSRFDFKIINENSEITYVEVKSVLIAKENVGMFPVGNKKNGTVSERANKHVNELATLAKNGSSCAIVFMVLREDVHSFSPNTQKDPLFAEYLKNAKMLGVSIYAFQCSVTKEGIFFKQKLPVNFN